MDLNQISSHLKAHGFAKFIHKHSEYLYTRTNADTFASKLMSMRIIQTTDTADLVDEVSDARKTSKLYAMISKKDTIEPILQAMEASGHEHILDFMREEFLKESGGDFPEQVVDESNLSDRLSPRIQQLLTEGEFFEKEFLQSTLEWNAEELMAQENVSVLTSNEALKTKLNQRIKKLVDRNAENTKKVLEDLQRHLVNLYSPNLALFHIVDREKLGHQLHVESLRFVSEKRARKDQDYLPEDFKKILRDSEQTIQTNLETLRKALYLYERCMRTYITKYKPLPSSTIKMYHHMAQALVAQELKEDLTNLKILSRVQSSLFTIFNSYCIQNFYTCATMMMEDLVGIYVDEKSISVYPNKDYQKYDLCVYISNDGNILCGDEAKLHRQNQEAFVFDLLDLVGRDFQDPHIKCRLAQWPFKVTADAKGAAVIVSHGKLFSPATLLSAVIQFIIGILRANGRHTPAVKIAPSFTGRQRQEISLPLTNLGIVVSAVSSLESDVTTSFLLSDIVRSQPWKVQIVLLLIDLKETTCTFKLLKVSPQEEATTKTVCLDFPAPTLLASKDVITFGSKDFVENVAKYAITEFEKKHGEAVINPDMRILCEKIAFNGQLRHMENNKLIKLYVSKFYRHLDLQVELTSADIEMINQEAYRKLTTHCLDFLKEADVDLKEIGHATICGNAPRIGFESFEGAVLRKCRGLVVSNYVVQQLAYNQSMINVGSQLVEKILFYMPVSIGIQVRGGRMLKLAKRGSKLPLQFVRSSNEFYVTDNTRDDMENEAFVRVYAGEDEVDMCSNVRLCEFKFNQPGATPGRCSVAMAVNIFGQLDVTVHFQKTGESRSAKVHVMARSDLLGKEA